MSPARKAKAKAKEKRKAGKSKKGDKEKGKNKGKGKVSKEENQGKGKRGERSTPKKQLSNVIKKPDYQLIVGHPTTYAHIEYLILPEKPAYSLDVNCWGPIAKVYCDDGEQAFRIKHIGNKSWVPIKVKHYLPDLTIEELVKVQSHVIKFVIYTNKDKLAARAKGDTTQVFFIKEEHISTNDTVRAFPKNPNVEKPEHEALPISFDKEISRIKAEFEIKKLRKAPLIATHLNYFSDEVHDSMVNKIIADLLADKIVKCRIFSLETQSRPDSAKKTKGRKKEKKKSKKNRKSKKGKKGDSVPKIAVPGEVFFTDPQLVVFGIEKPLNAISNAYAILTVKNFMTRKQKMELNPIVIKIKKISNLPVKALEEAEFKRIRVHYKVPEIGEQTTFEKPLEDTVRFHEAHVHFLKDTPKQKILDLIASRTFFVEIQGIRDISRKEIENPSIFGTDYKDENISKKMNAYECREQLQKKLKQRISVVAVASFDISSLLVPTWIYSAKHPCHSPGNCTFSAQGLPHPVPLELTDRVTVQDVHIRNMHGITSEWSLTEEILLTSGTTLEIESFLQSPQDAILHLQSLSHTYRRMFIIVKNTEIAITLLNEIMIHNQEYFIPEVVTTNYMRKGGVEMVALDDKLKGRESEITYTCFRNDAVLPAADVISGFLIDNLTCYAFFLEGHSKGFLATIWRQFMNLNESLARMYFNSNLIFDDRLYEQLLLYGAFYPITLHTSIQGILAHQNNYLKGNVPIPCWEALKKLDLLFRSPTLKSMFQNMLLPTARELISLNIEWGVPLRWDVPVPMPKPKKTLKSNKDLIAFKSTTNYVGISKGAVS